MASKIQRILSWMWQGLSDFGRRLVPHALPLLGVGVAIAIGQYVTFWNHPMVMIFHGDSTDYIAFANSMLSSFHVLDPARTPGYPLILAIIFALTGGQSLPVVIIAQVVLIIHALFMVYLLIFRLSRNRWMAMGVTVLLSLNSYLLNWEREILSEPLTIWLMVMIFLLIERYVRVQRAGYLIALTALMTYCVFMRPFYVYVPALVFAAILLYALRNKRAQQEWKRILAAVLISYGLVGSFALGNGIEYGYYGVSEISSVNLFAKVMEYHMQTEYTDPQYALISAQLDAFEQQGGGVQPFVFLDHLYKQYELDHYAFAADYAKDIFIHHPVEYAQYSLGDTWLAMTLPQLYYDQRHVDPSWFTPFTWIAAWSMYTYLLLPLILIAALVWWWRQPRSGVAMILLLLALTQLGALLEIGFLSYAYPYRLRMPLDWAMLAMAGVLLAQAIRWGAPKHSSEERPVFSEQSVADDISTVPASAYLPAGNDEYAAW
jgi:4-amino-4-deoxy-L-arabinose transferase-like glycosyltransferase